MIIEGWSEVVECLTLTFSHKSKKIIVRVVTCRGICRGVPKNLAICEAIPLVIL